MECLSKNCLKNLLMIYYQYVSVQHFIDLYI